MSLAFIAFLFFLIALLYASVGFGGGSSYIALLMLGTLPIAEIRFIALICNIIVVTGSTINYYRAGYLDLKAALPLVLFSIPLAFIGGRILPPDVYYKVIASIALITASLLILFGRYAIKEERHFSTFTLSGVGGFVGLLSGIIGIGGGIFLSPILHISRWATPIKISAMASFFILVNSVAGLVGQWSISPDVSHGNIYVLVLMVFLGGQIGNRLNLHLLSVGKIRNLTAILVGLVGIHLLIRQLIIL